VSAGRRGTHPADRQHLRIDPTACRGVGICAHIAPQLIRLDSWGYPIVEVEPLSPGQQRKAHGAVTGCPRKALFVESK
jgi:ferredoxin